ncbi:hypothetical protein [Parasitella parasitica]|uniref:Uncharacterized protein n=1 Tax=Parasitella parasitica TaxID=35722 RepID=A0A0B7NRJ9_9FUNG|nr:hypothetical protein [Parasitella parasitica]
MSSKRKRQRTIAADVQRCMDNRNILTCKAFVDQHQLLDSQYSVSRYKTIISKYLPQEKDRLIQDYDQWKRSSDYKLYWLEKSRTSVQLDTRVECSSFAGDVLRQETAAITSSVTNDYANIDLNIDSNNNMGMAASSSSSTAIQDDENIPSSPIPTTSSTTTPLGTVATTTEAPPRFPWLIGDFDVADAFYRDTMLNFLDLAQLQKLHYSLLTELLNESITLPDDIYLKLVYAVTDVDAKVKTRGHVKLLLLPMAQDLDIRQQSVARGITAAKLSFTAIKDKSTIGEGELLTTYFDPILANILANLDENVLLRWANVTCDATGDKRPDAAISELTQMSFGPSLGFGEAKVA